jgi:cytochrome c oxidase subunit 2
MGKAFAALLAIVTLASVYFFAARTWWMPVDISAHGPGVDHQIIETMLLTGVLFLLSQLALAGFVWKFGGPGEGRKISTFPGGAKVVVFAVFVVVGIEILTLSFFGSKVWAGMFFAPAAPNSLHIDVQAEQFAFFFRYAGPDGQFGGIHPELINDGNGNYFGLDPANDVAARDDIVVGSLTIPVNTPILLTLHTKDMIHSFFVPELRIQQDIVPGLEIPIHFTAVQTGKHEIVCTQLCGLGHYNMKAYIEVLPQDKYDEWLKSQSQ